MPAALSAFATTPLAFLDGLGGMEMLLVFVIGLMLFGGKGLPDMARTLGKAIREFKKATAGVEDQFKRAIEDQPAPPPPPRRAPPAVQPRAIETPPAPPPAPPPPTTDPSAGPAPAPPSS